MRPQTKTSTDGEHPLVAALLEPLLELRGSLGDGTPPPKEALEALAAAADNASAAEAPLRNGVYLLESTGTALAAVPVTQRTGTEVAALADHHKSLADLITSAYTTRDTAATQLDTIINTFRTNASAVLTAARDQYAVQDVIELAAQAIGSGVNVVNHARDEMAGLTDLAQVYDRGQAPSVTVPAGFAAAPGVLATDPTSDSTIVPTSSSTTTPAPSAKAPTSTGTVMTNPMGNPMSTAIPAGTDPQVAAQMMLQQALISGGVQLGTAAIDGGVQIGTHLIDGVVQVANHGIDVGSKLAEQGLSTMAAGAGDPASNPTSSLNLGGPQAPDNAAPKPGNAPLFGELGGTQSPPAATNKGQDPGVTVNPDTPKPGPTQPIPQTHTTPNPPPSNGNQPGAVMPPAPNRSTDPDQSRLPSPPPQAGVPGQEPSRPGQEGVTSGLIQPNVGQN
jgi:hypothetical protein